MMLVTLAFIQAPDASAIVKAGAETAARLSTTPASWTADVTLENGTTVSVSCIHALDRSRFIVSADIGGKSLEFGRLITREGVWYASDELGFGKYRPYEAPFMLPSMYLYFSHAELRFVTDAAELKSATFERVENGIASYRIPLPAGSRSMLEAALKDLERIKGGNPEKARSVAAQEAQIREALARGMPLRIQISTGLVVYSGSQKMRIQWRDFRWIEKIAEPDFEIGGRTWPDHTSDPTIGDRGELLMIGRSAVWRPSAATLGDLDVLLVNLKTGATRRVPLSVQGGLSGCFTKDRTGVVLPGIAGDGRMTLYHVDLKTGINRELGANLITQGFCLDPVLSPDGSKVAAVHMPGGVGEFRMTVIELGSGKATYVGGPMDTASLSWLPDASGFILVRRQFKAMDKPQDRFVARLDLDGKLTDLCAGDLPLLLPDGKRILFLDGQKWKTCSLAGKEVMLFGDGLSGHMQPTLAPDGKRVIFVRTRAGKEPHIVMFGLDGGELKLVLREPGLWLYPGWK